MDPEGNGFATKSLQYIAMWIVYSRGSSTPSSFQPLKVSPSPGALQESPWSLWSHYGIFSKFIIFSQKNKKLRIRWIYGPVILETLKSVLKLPNTFEDEEPYCTLQYHTVQTKIYCILPGSGLRNLTTPEEDDVPYVQ